MTRLRIEPFLDAHLMTATNSALETAARRDRLRWSLGIFSFALLVRGLHLWQLRGSPLFDMLIGDARSYSEWARTIADGDWLGSEVFYQAPLYPYFLAVVYAAVGDGALAVRGVQIVLGAASCALLAGAGWRFFSKPAGIVAGALLAVYAPALFADTTIQKSVLDIFLLCLALWILAGFVVRPHAWSCAALGLVLGALVLSRENALVFAFVLVPWLFLHASALGTRRWVWPVVFFIGMASVLFPVAMRNAHVGGAFHLTTSQFGPNFYIGNNPAADGTYVPLRAGRGDPKYEREDATALAEAALGRSLAPGEVSQFFAGRAFEYIVSQPADWLRLMGRKVALAFNAVELVDTEDPYTHAESSLVLRLLGTVLHFGVLAPLALFGAWVTWSDRTRLRPLYWMFMAFTASLLVFYVFGRYRLPLIPFLALFAGAGVGGLTNFVRAAGAIRVAGAAASVVAAGIFCNWPIVDVGYVRSVTHYNLGNEFAARDRLDAAVAEYREAIRLYAGNALATHNLGVMMAREGDLATARAHYERALRIRPSYADAHINLARTLQEVGDAAGAAMHYESGLQSEPGRAEVYHELGLVYRELGELSLARACFEQTLHLDPEHQEARRDLMRTAAPSVVPAHAASACRARN